MKQNAWFLLLGILFFSACQEDHLEKVSEKNSYPGKKEVIWLNKSVDPALLTKTVGVKSKYWQIGDTIRIKFLNGDASYQQKVKQYAEIWLAYANLYFKYVEPDEYADVKIGFNLDDRYISLANLGADCKAVP